MATQKTITNPYDVTQQITEYGHISLFQAKFDASNLQNNQLRIDTTDFAGKAAFLAGSPPLYGKSVVIPVEGIPAMDEQKRRLYKRENGTYVLENDKEDPNAQVIIPTYAEVPPVMDFLRGIVAPEGGIPAGTPLFDYIMGVIYNFIVTRPEYQGCTVVDI